MRWQKVDEMKRVSLALSTSLAVVQILSCFHFWFCSWLSRHLPSLSHLLLHLSYMSFFCGYFLFVCLCFGFHFHFLSFYFCSHICSVCFHLRFRYSFHFHSFFLKNGSPHEETSSVPEFCFGPLLCLMNM